MFSLSLCMIVRDESGTIRRCLNSIKDIVDEIIIVDTGSLDNTKEICKEFTEKIYDFKWVDDFSKARNFSFSKSNCDYILWMDADEYFDEQNKIKLKNIKENLSDNIDGIRFKTNTCVCCNNNLMCLGCRIRIIKKQKNYKWVGFVHEYIQVCDNSKILDSPIYIIHDKKKHITDRNLLLYKKYIESGNKLSDRDLYYYGKELHFNKYYEDCILILNEYISKDINIDEIIESLCIIGKSYMHLNKLKTSREYYFKCFEYTTPNPDIMYNIAESFEIQKEFEKAIYWYEIILKLQNENFRTCLNLNHFNFNINLSLCVCNYELGFINKSYFHHIKCKELYPDNKCVISNDEIFNKLINREG